MAETTHGADHAVESAPGMPQLDFSTFPNQIFWLLVTLVVLYFILNRIALPRIASVLADRQGAIQRDLDSAEQMKRQALEAEEAYNKALADARAQAQDIVGEAKADIQKDLDKAILKADAEIAAKAAESEKAIKEIRDSSAKSIQEVANAAAADIVKAMMPGSGDAKTIKAAVAARLKG
ncbi:ATP synthase subunit b 2 [Amylibacter ulvae]|uniref:ATP synthase subunit b n=1 Tax=Paramylibacter ulvae TaxID=1651968 RepID=A0ABQ3D6V3_9RHOB|nr:F0F1 ATP synthase subunit B' [Amylibacter ulvae]GHA57650.1 ATP synthase subunit b 2 [Amylibacter ulvae]